MNVNKLLYTTSHSKLQKKINRQKLSYLNYIYKILKQVHKQLGISSKAIHSMDSFVNDIFSKIIIESRNLAFYNKNKTLTAREIQTSIRLLFPSELSKFAIKDGTKSIAKYKMVHHMY